MSEIRTPPKRLVDLNPKWVRAHGSDRRVGVAFDCPCGEGDACDWGGRVYLTLENPPDGGPPWPVPPNWHRDGDDFETLTLSPSIHAPGHWHGWLRRGVLESC